MTDSEEIPLARCPYKPCQAFNTFKKTAEGHYRCELCGTLVVLKGSRGGDLEE